jgi:PAS domain S-box-containing protein
VFRDVSAEKAAEDALRHSEEKLRLMIASVRDCALYMLDPNGRVVSWNPGAERIKGYREEEIVGQSFSRFFTPEAVADGKPERELAIARDEGRFEEEGWRLRKDGTRFWAHVVVTPIRDRTDALVGFAKITRDLTERRRTEEERLKLVQAQEAVRLRDEFLSIASHELRTPLTALLLQLQNVGDRLAAGADERLASGMERARRIGARLAQLVEALLDVSRISAGKLKLSLEPFDLGDAAREVIERLRDTAQSARSELVLEVAGPTRGRWDRLRVEQLLMNLIMNSIKYAAGQPIRVVVSRDADEGRLQILDRGPGIPETELSRIFERFERAASERHYGGMGLGLYIARQIAEAHNGTIAASNLSGGGACFTVRLPLDSRPAGPAPR